MATTYSEELLVHQNYGRVYYKASELIENKLEHYPTFAALFGGGDPNLDEWTMNFLFTNTKKLTRSLLPADECLKNPLNPQIIKMAESCETEQEFERDLAGEVKHWFSDLFDKTEFGLTRRVLEHDMEIADQIIEGTFFDNVAETNLWHLKTCLPAQTKFPEPAIHAFARPYKDSIKWPTDQQYDDWREGRKDRRPRLDRKQMVACLQDVMQKAEGSVQINVITRAIIALHPYMVRDGSDRYSYFDDDDSKLTNVTYEDAGYDADDYSTDEFGGEL